MLRVRQQQWKELGKPRRGDFTRRAAAHIQQCWPESAEQWREPGLESFVDAAIDDAAGLEIESEKDVVRYIDIQCLTERVLLKDSRYAWARKLLEQRELPANERLDAVWSRLIREIEKETGD